MKIYRSVGFSAGKGFSVEICFQSEEFEAEIGFRCEGSRFQRENVNFLVYFLLNTYIETSFII